MKKFTLYFVFSVGMLLSFNRVMSQQIAIDFQNASYNATTDELCFDVYAGAGTGYPGGAPWSTMNLRVDFDMDILSGTPGLAPGATATFSNVNSTYVAGTLTKGSPAPGGVTPGYDFGINISVNRGGAPTDLPATPVRLFSICIPVINGDFDESSMTDNITLRQVDLPASGPNTASFWTSTIGGGGARSFGNETEPLPIELLVFEPRINKCEIGLYWETASEKSLSHYEIEASKDGQRFVGIGQVKPKSSDSFEKQIYKYDLKNNYQRSYFRLKAVDLDGAIQYSPVVYAEVDCKQTYAAQVYPNPNYTSELTVEINSPQAAEQAELHLVDNFGRLIRTQRVDIKEGINKIQLATADLPSGTYSIKVIGIVDAPEPLRFVRTNF